MMNTMMNMFHETCVVTGGRGFVARHLVTKLLEEGKWTVHIVDLAPSIELSQEEKSGPLPAALESGRAVYICADLRNEEQIAHALKGAHVVFHMASPNPNNNDFSLQYSVNVGGTRVLLEESQRQGVKIFVYTSSASVVFNGLFDIKNGDETLPYPEKFLDFYGETKAQAEQLVLSANGKGGMLTISLRPSGVFGPGDPVLLPTSCKNALAGKLKYIIGDGENMIDFTYVDNVVHAHLCAESALKKGGIGPNAPSGKPFFITNGEPRKFWEFLFDLLIPLGYDPPVGKLPAALVLNLAFAVQFAMKYLGPLGVPPLEITPSRIRIVTTWRVFSCAEAAKLIGYSPLVPLQEGVKRTLAASAHFRRDVLAAELGMGKKKKGPSKAHALLGGGPLADTLLWRSKTRTGAVLAGALSIYWLLFASSITFISLISLISGIALYGIITLAAYEFARLFLNPRFGFELPDVVSRLELSEEHTIAVGKRIQHHWNSNIHPHVVRLAEAEDTYFCLKVMLGLVVAAYAIGYFHTGTLLGMGIVAAFALPLVYEKYEEEVDGMIEVVSSISFARLLKHSRRILQR